MTFQLGNGPKLVRGVDDRIGGLWPGQLLFTSEQNGEALVFCTWWPWGDGNSISIRIGLEHKNLPESAHAEKVRLFKSCCEV